MKKVAVTGAKGVIVLCLEKVWLSHKDCVGLVRACIEAKQIPNNFLIVHGISNNKRRVHSFSNPLGWRPVDGAGD